MAGAYILEAKYGQVGLEVAPSDGPEVQPSQDPIVVATPNRYYARSAQESGRPRRICGLKPLSFWLVLAVIMVVIVGAIGGGVGGALADQKNSSSASPNSSSTNSPSPGTTSFHLLAPTAGPPDGCHETFAGQFSMEYVSNISTMRQATTISVCESLKPFIRATLTCIK